MANTLKDQVAKAKRLREVVLAAVEKAKRLNLSPYDEAITIETALKTAGYRLTLPKGAV